ncbi:MAG: hypothetical protein GXO50_04780 [Chlorobi bacterium]|nr:hypothetical protein [Chlorobiota bacterium]
MKRLLLLPVLFVIFLSVSCQLTQEYHFNKDLSGSYSFEMKMGDFLNMMQSMDTSGNFESTMDTLDKSFDMIMQKYGDAGAKNVKAGWKDDKTTLYVKFDFTSPDDLNSIFLKSSEGSGFDFFGGKSGGAASFSHKGKRRLSMDFPELDDSISTKDFASVKDYISVETIFSFDRRIKSISNKNAEISADGKSFKFSGKADDFLNKDYSMDTDVKLRFK